MKLLMSGEMIHYSKSELGDALAHIFQKTKDVLNKVSLTNEGIVKGLKDEKYDITHVIPDIVQKYTNIKLELTINTNIAGAVMVFPFNRNNILLKEKFRDSYFLPGEAKILAKAQEKKGYVDLENAKLEGIFTEYTHTLFLDLRTLFVVWNMTAREVTAIVLHEIGHVFTYYEYSTRLSTTNQLLADLSYSLHNNENDIKKREYVFKELVKNNVLSEKESEELYNEVDNTILGRKLFKVYVREITSLRDNIKYDETTSEALADNFAVRQGFGLDLVTALDHLYKFSPERNRYILSLMFTSELVMDFIVVPVFITGLLINPASLPIGIVLLLLLSTAYFTASVIDFKDMSYDELRQRYNRVRIGIIGQLKDKNLDKKTVKDIIENLDTIESILSDVHDTTSLKMRLGNFLLPSSRATVKDISRQQYLEELAYNPFFVTSAKLKHGV